MAKRFLVYGLMGLGIEIFWTGLCSLLSFDFTLVCHTSFWMLPIYGMVVFLEPIFDLLEDMPILLKGGIYALAIFVAEYVTGLLLTKMGVCPWNYTGSRFSVGGLIRLDYGPAWAVAGLIYEKVYKQIKFYGVTILGT